MSSNIFLYDFNGSVQRNKLQDAIFRDLAQKDEFMKRLEEERLERQLLAKKKSAAIKIQSWYRANRTRRRFHALLRQNFDAVGKVATLDVLSAQIARLVLFFKANEDLGRTMQLCTDAVALARPQPQVQERCLSALKCRQLVRCVVGALPVIRPTCSHSNYIPALRCLEVYLRDERETVHSLAEYFRAIVALYANNFELTQPAHIEEWLAPRADAVLRFLILPLRRTARPEYVLRSLLITLVSDVKLQDDYETQLACVTVPFLSRMVQSGEFSLADVMRAMDITGKMEMGRKVVEIIPKERVAVFAYMLGMFVRADAENGTALSSTDRLALLSLFADLVQYISRPVREKDKSKKYAEIRGDSSDSDDDSEAPRIPNAASEQQVNLPGTPGFYVDWLVDMLSGYILREVEVVLRETTGLQNVGKKSAAIGAVAQLAYFLRENSDEGRAAVVNLMGLLVSNRDFVAGLWEYTVGLRAKVAFGTPKTLISVLEKGDCIMGSEQPTLVAPLSLFIVLLSNILQTIDDDDLLGGGVNFGSDYGNQSVFPFDLKQIASIATHFRDLTLGLIDIAYPVVNYGAMSGGGIGFIGGGGAKVMTSEEREKNAKWAELFRNVASITKVLYERDSRLHFMPNGFWSNHNRQVVINTSMWRNGGRGQGGRRRGQGGPRNRPFEFVRFLLYDADDLEAEPPSAVELRNLSILRAIPFVIPFLQRVQMFTEVIAQDKAQIGADENFGFPIRDGHHIVVHRTTLYEDAFESLAPGRVPDMRRPIRVQMVNWVGLDEAGIDGGGIFREFLSETLQTALDPSRGFFAATHDNLLYPNPLAPFLYPGNFEDHFYFIGRLIAKLIYEAQLVDIRFADFFLLQWFGMGGWYGGADNCLDLEYVKSYDPLLHHNLKYLKRCSPDEVAGLELDFSVLIDNLGVTEKVELKRNGSEIKVTAENRAEYIALYVNYFLSKRLQPMISSLRAGVRAVIDPAWLRMFSSSELSILIGGIDSEIDFDDLRKFTTVHNIKSDHDRLYADLFWVVINEFGDPEKKKLLKFITGCSRPPLIGFKALTPPMGVQLIHEPDKLPTAATCMNLLKLPVYPDTKTLRHKLLLAINSAAGFELS